MKKQFDFEHAYIHSDGIQSPLPDGVQKELARKKRFWWKFEIRKKHTAFTQFRQGCHVISTVLQLLPVLSGVLKWYFISSDIFKGY